MHAAAWAHRLAQVGSGDPPALAFALHKGFMGAAIGSHDNGQDRNALSADQADFDAVLARAVRDDRSIAAFRKVQMVDRLVWAPRVSTPGQGHPPPHGAA